MFNFRNILKNIAAANAWARNNRPNWMDITLDEVITRLKNKASFLSIKSDAKTSKGEKIGYKTGILYLAPHKITGFNLCAFAVTCIKDCLFSAGRGRHTNVTRHRIIKTLAYLLCPELFEAHLRKDIARLAKSARRAGMLPVVRINGTSDITIERAFKNLLAEFPDVQFYDYTKNPTRFVKKLPDNYDLTFSYDGTNWNAAKQILDNGGRVAVVFSGDAPAEFNGYPVIDGDASDLRFLDDGGVIVGLTPKGLAKKSTANTDFVVSSAA